MGKPEFQFRIVQNISSIKRLKTEKMFDSNYSESDSSAIDTFIEKTKELNRLFSLKPLELPPHLANLILLGYVSAVESYLRMLLRQLICIDEPSRCRCESQLIKFGAAISYDHEMLPESLLENFSFISKKSIRDAFSKLLEIGNIPSDVDDTLDRYEIVCQARHCIVHRFGHLGANNAIELGLSSHKEFLNKPIKLNFDLLQEMLLICTNSVKVINNFLFQKILLRTADKNKALWKWDYRKDKKMFEKYFNLFYSKEESEGDFKTLCREAYNQLKSHAHQYRN